MRRLTLTLTSCLMLICGSMAFADMGPTAQGYYFDLTNAPVELFVYPSAQPPPGSRFAKRLPAVETLRVSVTDAEGNPVDDVPVTFTLEADSQLKGMVEFTSERTMTQDGTAYVTIQPTNSATSGVGHIIARVGNMTDRVLVYVHPAGTANPSPS